MKSPFSSGGFRFFIRGPKVIFIPSLDEDWKRSPTQTRRPNHQAQAASGGGREIEVHLYSSDAIVQSPQEMYLLENDSSRILQAKRVFSGFHTDGQKKADAQRFPWKMYLVRCVLGLLAASRREGSQVYSHRKGWDWCWTPGGCSTRLRL